MCFIAGPRQVGKTTLARQALAGHPDGGLYLNWDISSNRRRILGGDDILADIRHPGKLPLVVFDELHKMRRFKAWLKGFYDENHGDAAVWVTGSARLDLYQKGGDSLLGRYFLYRLHPLTIGETDPCHNGQGLADPDDVWERFTNSTGVEGDIQPFLAFGGFPEPLLRQQATFHRRWLRSRRARITHEELRDLTRIQDLDRVEHLVELLNPRVGSPLSINSLRGDLQVAFDTVRSWLAALRRLYYVFAVRPYDRKVQRAITKEWKCYYWDWSEVRDAGARFENLVMSHLLKACHTWTDLGLGEFDLRYVRDREKREVDAVVTREGTPWLLAEVKIESTAVSPHLMRFAKVLDCPRAVQVVKQSGIHRRVKKDGRILHVVSAGALLRHFP